MNLQVSVKVRICENAQWKFATIAFLFFFFNLYSYLDIVWKILLHFQSTARWEKGHDQSYQQTPYLRILTNKLHLQWLDLGKQRILFYFFFEARRGKERQGKSRKGKVFLKWNLFNSVIIFSLFSTPKFSVC